MIPWWGNLLGERGVTAVKGEGSGKGIKITLSQAAAGMVVLILGLLGCASF